MLLSITTTVILPAEASCMLALCSQIDYVMTWAEKLLADEGTFPTKAGREFNSNTFPSCARHLYTQFLRIFAHLYHAHFDHILHVRHILLAPIALKNAMCSVLTYKPGSCPDHINVVIF